MTKKIRILLLVLVALFIGAPSAHAQTAAPCADTYTVKAGDWLSKLAGEFLGDINAYPQIVAATNADHSGAYNHIADPNFIRSGWKLCIPAASTGHGIQVNYDFRHGAQGWVAGFSDYPPGQEDFFELASGIRDIPSVTPSVPAYMLSGNNHSDDLFMFLKRKLDASNGIQPNTTYTLTFKIVFASNAPSDCFGVGGAPGEGITLKAGGSSIEPLPVDHDGMYQMNVDKGNQAMGGPAGDVVSSIANGLPCDDPSHTPYVSLTRDHVSQYPVTSDTGGNLWLMVGTDSGFEATTTLYYQEIEVGLTPQTK